MDLYVIMGLALYISYIILLVVLPLLAYRRWGLAASLAVTVVELGWVLFNWYEVPAPPPRGPIPERGRDPFTGGRPGEYAEQFAHGLEVLFLVMIPAIAALIGGALSLMRSAVLASRRYLANRRTEPQ
jgi:hypothetical protein